jgi:hypothetical protein
MKRTLLLALAGIGLSAFAPAPAKADRIDLGPFTIYRHHKHHHRSTATTPTGGRRIPMRMSAGGNGGSGIGANARGGIVTTRAIMTNTNLRFMGGRAEAGCAPRQEVTAFLPRFLQRLMG